MLAEWATQQVTRDGVPDVWGEQDVLSLCAPKLVGENDEIADLLVGLRNAKRSWGFGLCFLYLRNVQGRPWNHRRGLSIYREPELNLPIEPRKRRRRDKPDALCTRLC